MTDDRELKGTFWFTDDEARNFSGSIKNEELIIDLTSFEDEDYLTQRIKDRNQFSYLVMYLMAKKLLPL